MIVDDEIMNLEILLNLLEVKGHPCDTTLSGSEAIEMVAKRLHRFETDGTAFYKLILLDFSMPIVDGPQVARQITKLFAESQALSESGERPKIFCCSAYNSKDFKRQAIDAGMDKFFTKPISSDDLDHFLKLASLV